MTMEQINSKMLSIGITRKEYFDELNKTYSQEPVEYNGWFIKKKDIPYGSSSDRQKYDVYMPMAPGQYPTLLLVHGGGWFMGDRSDFSVGARIPYIAHGFTLVSIGYRLANEAVFPDPVEDVCNAIKQILEHAEEYRIDPDRIMIMSGSAGTTIAALTAVKNPEIIKAAVLRCAILNFENIRSQFEQIGLKRERFAYPDQDTSIEALFMGGSTLEMPELVKQTNPSNYITKDCPKFLLIHGMIDVDTPYLQSVSFVQDINEKTGDPNRAQLLLLPDTGHDNGLYDHPSTFETTLDFLRKNV